MTVAVSGCTGDHARGCDGSNRSSSLLVGRHSLGGDDVEAGHSARRAEEQIGDYGAVGAEGGGAGKMTPRMASQSEVSITAYRPW